MGVGVWVVARTGVRAIRNAVFLAAIKLNIAITAPIAIKMPLKMHSMHMQKCCPGGERGRKVKGARTSWLYACVRECVQLIEGEAQRTATTCVVILKIYAIKRNIVDTRAREQNRRRRLVATITIAVQPSHRKSLTKKIMEERISYVYVCIYESSYMCVCNERVLYICIFMVLKTNARLFYNICTIYICISVYGAYVYAALHFIHSRTDH